MKHRRPTLLALLLPVSVLALLTGSCGDDKKSQPNPAASTCSLAGIRCEFGCTQDLGCVECLPTAEQCEPGAPFCVLGRCVACSVSGDCGTGQACYPGNHTCQTACAANADCPRSARRTRASATPPPGPASNAWATRIARTRICPSVRRTAVSAATARRDSIARRPDRPAICRPRGAWSVWWTPTVPWEEDGTPAGRISSVTALFGRHRLHQPRPSALQPGQRALRAVSGRGDCPSGAPICSPATTSAWSARPTRSARLRLRSADPRGRMRTRVSNARRTPIAGRTAALRTANVPDGICQAGAGAGG